MSLHLFNSEVTPINTIQVAPLFSRVIILTHIISRGQYMFTEKSLFYSSYSNHAVFVFYSSWFMTRKRLRWLFPDGGVGGELVVQEKQKLAPD